MTWTVTLVEDSAAPTVSTRSPTDNGTDVAIDATLTVTFNEPITLGASGVISLKLTSDNSTIDSWDVATDGGSGAGQVEVLTNTALTLHLTTDLANNVEYYVVWDAGVVKDLVGNGVGAVSTTTTWSFTTVSVVGGYATLGAVFDGTDYMTGTTNTALTGAADSKKFTISFWFKPTGSDGSYVIHFEQANQHGFNLYKIDNNSYSIAGYDSAGAQQVQLNSSFYNKILANSGWRHILCSVDTTTGVAVGRTYVDGVRYSIIVGDGYENGAYVVPTDAIMDYDSASTHSVFARGAGSLPFIGEAADFAIWYDQYIDLDDEANRLLFRDAAGRPVDLGATGELPFGAGNEPIFMLRASTTHGESVANYHVNKGTGGDIFTLTGTLAEAATSPTTPYTTLAAAFDGSDDAAGTATTAYTGAADGKWGTVSFWFRVNGSDGADRVIYNNSLGKGFEIAHTTSNTIRIKGTDSSAAVVLQLTSVSAFTAGATWHHLVASWDLATGYADMWIDGVQDRTVNTANDVNINYAAAATQYFMGYAGGYYSNLDIADFALWFDRYVQLSYVGKIGLFRDADGKPVDLGLNGSRPLGGPPIAMFRASDFHGESVSNFYVNKGSGGLTFTPTGTLTEAATSPSGEWTPLGLGAKLVAWYDADFGVYSDAGTTPATDTDLVYQWNDQSGNGYHIIQATSGDRPTYNATGFNSAYKTVTFVPGRSLATTTDAVAMGTGTTGSAFIVGQMLTGTATYGRIVTYLATGQTVDYSNSGSAAWILRANAADSFETFRNNSEFATTAISLATNYRLGIIYDGANVTSYVNNSAGTPAANSAAWGSPGTLSIGPSAGAGAGWAGPVSEVVITNSALNLTERNQLDAYFKAKWGL